MRCAGGQGRHWFTQPGAVGLARPTCYRCDAPRPRPLNAEQQAAWDDYLSQFRSMPTDGEPRPAP